METRVASLADGPVLAVLHEKCFGAARWSLAQITESLRLDTTATFVAEEAGSAVGFILCQITRGVEAEILTFCTAPYARRRGVGRLLLQEAVAAARQQKAARMFLEVAVDNTAALQLYQNAGFRRVGARPRYYRRDGGAVDAALLELVL